jgi:hypothetical protein
MSQPMGNFVRKPANTGDQFQARFAVGRPLIVQVVAVDEAVPVAARDGKPATVKCAVSVHVWDLAGGQVSVNEQNMPVHGAPNTVYCNVRWMAGAVADNLKGYLGAPAMPMTLAYEKASASGFNYLVPLPIEGPLLQQVQAVFAADPTRIDREAAAKAQANAAQAAAPQYQQSGFTPMQVQPSAPAQQPVAQPQFQPVPAMAQGQPANAFQHTNGQIAAPAAAQWAVPQGQPGAIANIPAQVAQQWAPVDQAVQQYQAAPGQTPNGAPQALNQQFAPSDPNAPQNVAHVVNGGMQGAAQFQPGQVPNGQYPAQQPQFQPPSAAAPGPIGHVQNSDVQNILAGLAQGQPQQ